MACQREERWLLAGVAPDRTSRLHQVLNLLFKKAVKKYTTPLRGNMLRPSVLRFCALMAQGNAPPKHETGILQPQRTNKTVRWKSRRSDPTRFSRRRHFDSKSLSGEEDRRTCTDPRDQRRQTESVRSCKRRAPCASLAVCCTASGVEV